MKWLVAVLMVVLCLPFAARAQDLSALARLEPAQSFIRDAGQGVEVRFSLSQPVPWRVRFRADPPRMVLDVREVDWTGVETVLQGSAHVTGLRAGVFRPGWSRLVLDLSGPMALSLAEMSTANDTQLLLRLDPASPEVKATACVQLPEALRKRYAPPAPAPRSGAPTSARDDRVATEAPKRSPATPFDATSFAVCDQVSPEMLRNT